MNPNDCQSCVWKEKPDGGWCYWWEIEPVINCNWFKYKDARIK